MHFFPVRHLQGLQHMTEKLRKNEESFHFLSATVFLCELKCKLFYSFNNLALLYIYVYVYCI